MNTGFSFAVSIDTLFSDAPHASRGLVGESATRHNSWQLSWFNAWYQAQLQTRQTVAMHSGDTDQPTSRSSARRETMQSACRATTGTTIVLRNLQLFDPPRTNSRRR